MFNKTLTEEQINNDSISGSYNTSLTYDLQVMQKTYFPYQYDGWKIAPKYGIYNDKNKVIYPKRSALKNYVSSNSSNQKNLIFVVEAYQDMNRYIKDLIKRRIIEDVGSPYTKFNIYESTTNAEEMYISHLNKINNVFFNQYKNVFIKTNLNNFNSFINTFLDYLKLVTIVLPFTRHKFIGSNLVPQTINGLCLTIDTEKKINNFLLKTDKYIDNQIFSTFVGIASRFGFMIDRNVPWRLVADLESSAMKKYYSKYFLKNSDDIFKQMYYEAEDGDIVSLKNTIISFWNRYVQENSAAINTIERSNCKNLFSEITELKFLDEKTFEYYFNINWQLRLYCYIRILEENINISQEKFNVLHDQSCKINNIYNIKEAVNFINSSLLEYKKTIRDYNLHDLTNDEALFKVVKEAALTLPSTGLIF